LASVDLDHGFASTVVEATRARWWAAILAVSDQGFYITTGLTVDLV
jgi:hypothetical protein